MLTVRADIEASAMEPFALNVDRSGWKVDTYNIALEENLPFTSPFPDYGWK